MLNAGVLSFREWAMKETLPLAMVHDAVLQFLRGRDDAAIFGAHAVNAYADEPRMTPDVDVMSLHAHELAESLGTFLRAKFHIAACVREVAGGKGWRVYQVRKEGNRHLVDVRPVTVLPETQTVEAIRVLAPAELIASKVTAWTARRGQPKAGTDWRDLAILLLTFPDLKSTHGAVADILQRTGADEKTLAAWRDIVAQNIQPLDEDADFDW